jgi:hypothetical protein
VRHRPVDRAPDPAFAFVPATNHIVSAKQAPLFPSALLGCTLTCSAKGIVIKALPSFITSNRQLHGLGRQSSAANIHLGFMSDGPVLVLLAENALDGF